MYTPKFLTVWTLPQYYAGTPWDGFYSSGFGQSRDSDCLERSNFAVALKALQEVSERVEVVHEGHWAVGWVEWIAIPADDYAALRVADELREAYENYPVLDDDHFSALEREDADSAWEAFGHRNRMAYMRKFRRQFEFHTLADMLGCARGKYFAGIASEFLR